MPYYTAIVSLLVIPMLIWLGLRVAGAHRKYNVQLPAMAGDPAFDRIYRAHANTLEWLPNFLIPLWLCGYFLSDIGAAAVGVLWLVGRVMYAIGYAKAVDKRIPGFGIQALACLLLLVGAVVGLIRHMPN
jgi:glutathione S-transferase